MSKLKSPIILFLVTVIIISLLALFGPEEQSLGSNVRIVYLHGAWVLSAELAFLAAGLAGLIGLVSKKDLFHNWSAALGRTGIFFWVTYIPLSLWAMESNWNGLFLSEPRFRLGSDLCSDRCAVTTRLVAHQHELDHIVGKPDLYYCLARHLCHSIEHDASASIADLQFRGLRHHRILPRHDLVVVGSRIFYYALIPNLEN